MIKTKDDWWNIVNKNWDNILNMAADQLDMKYIAYEQPGDPNSKILDRTILQDMIYRKVKKDPNLARYFNAIWHLASEKYAYSKPGWGHLCDLCSEEYVLYDEPHTAEAGGLSEKENSERNF